MLKLLLKKQLFEIFRSYFYDAKKNKARSRLATALYIGLFVLLMAGILGGIFTLLAVKLCGPLAAAGLGWLYFALMGLIAVLLGAFGSIFNTYAGLYLPKDNDLLLSMPVPVSSLVAARLSGVYLMGLMYSAVVILPAVIIYWATVGVTASAVLGGLVLALLISLAVLVLSCALGWVAAKISQKLRNKSLVVVLASLVFIGLYYFVYFKAQSVLQDLLANAGTYGAQIRSRAYPLYLFGSVGTGSGAAMLAVTAAVAALCGLMWVLLSRSFLHIATSTGKTARRTYRETALRRRSVDGALLHRELAHFAANPAYMLNCGLGTFLMPICAAAVLWKGGSLFAMLDALFADTEGSVPVMLCVLLCGLASMNLMTAPPCPWRKSLWLMQSLPVEPWQALRAKLRMQMLLTVRAAAVRGVRGHRLSPGPGEASGHGGVRRVLCPAGGPDGPDPGGEDAGADLDRPADAHQAKRAGDADPVRRHGLHDPAVCGLPAAARLAAGLCRIRSLLRGGQPVAVRGAAPVAAEKGRGAVCRPVTGPGPGLTFPEKLL
ncbi:MAG: hypothetical protein ACLVGA_10105 [Dysosmobacter sp.]